MKLMITGGGTGGHVTPGLAIARYFLSKRPDTEIRFVGTETGIEKKLVPREGFPMDIVEVAGLRRSIKPADLAYNVSAAGKALTARHHAKKLLRQYAPDCVIGCGGYVSYPVVAAAQALGIPTVLLEVNALPGKVTKLLAPKASRVLVCFEQARELLGNRANIRLTGAPVRGEIIFADRETARKKLGLLDNDKLVVSFWGSMGALYMNRHMAGMLALEAQKNASWRHVHATGAAAAKWLPEMLEQKNVSLAMHPNLVLTEYIYNMADYMAAADLVICRAGAATIGELCALGRASIMVPSPYVAENHQEKNARALEKAGACAVLTENECTPEKLYQMTAALLSAPDKCASMGSAAAKMAQLDAAEKIYRFILEAARDAPRKKQV